MLHFFLRPRVAPPRDCSKSISSSTGSVESDFAGDVFAAPRHRLSKLAGVRVFGHFDVFSRLGGELFGVAICVCIAVFNRLTVGLCTFRLLTTYTQRYLYCTIYVDSLVHTK